MEEPTQSIEVRKARQEDTDAIAAIYTESILARDSTMVTDPVSGAEMLERLSGLDPRETLLVAQEGESVIGWGIVKLYSERPGYRLACETSVFLKRDHLGQGIGSLVQKELMASARNGGFHHVL
ncbi:MAG: GNAT family N-acetyltransferase, partial [Bacteroidetes bacterium]|nr:GNAT family N-acetyltransferase [Bacteroidota bacterium]